MAEVQVRNRSPGRFKPAVAVHWQSPQPQLHCVRWGSNLHVLRVPVYTSSRVPSVTVPVTSQLHRDSSGFTAT